MNTTIAMETEEVNKQKVIRLIEEVFNKGRLDVADEIISPACVEHQRLDRQFPPGSQAAKAISTSLRSMFSDFTLSIEDIVARGDKVWLRMKGRGTNTGQVMGHPATGKKVEVDVIDVCRFEDGKMVDHWGVPDQLGMIEQIGLIK
ncbi:MAG: ester cyclase [Nitrososphaerota archaeon]|nr:ester cyclase [Nitrososphaerota archaeon]